MPNAAKKIAYTGVITALGIVLNLISFSIPPFGRASFVYLFSYLAGFFLGPWLGFVSAFLSDLLPALIAPQGVWMPLITLSCALMGMIPGLVFRFVKWKSFSLKLILSAALSFVVCTLGVGAAGSVPIFEYFPSAVALKASLGSDSKFLMLALSKLISQPFWVALNVVLTIAICQPVAKLLKGIGEHKMKKNIRVSAAIIRRDGKYLICRRGEGGSCAHLWEFPGGKIEAGETAEECALRECREELGTELRLGALYTTAKHSYPDRDVELYFFNAELPEGSPEPKSAVHDEIVWAEPSKLSDYPFCPADAALIESLKSAG